MSGSFNSAKLLIFGFAGPNPDKNFLAFVKKENPAGFLLLEGNYKNPGQLKKLTQLLKDHTNSNVIVAVDQEPGRVQRFKKEFPRSLTPTEYLINNKTKEYRIWCQDTAEMLSEAGVNCNLAPVVDLMSLDNASKVLRGRSFGDNPAEVAEMAIILIDEFRKFDIKTCAKHFPGLGSAIADPHEVLASSNDTAIEFEMRHFLPFKSAIASNVDFIMTTHIFCRALDDKNPATFSTKIIDILRKNLDYKGQIMSDDLYMSGAGDPQQLALSAEKSLKSGHNLLIISRDIELQKKTVECLNAKYENDDSFRKIINQNITS